MNNDNYPFNNQPSHHFPQSSFPNPIPEDDDDTPQLLSEPRRVNAGMGSRWIAHAWEIFKARWVMWLGMAFVMVLITGVLGEIPYIGWTSNFLNLFFMGGLMLSCDALVEGDELEFGYLFSGFKYKFVDLLVCNVIMFVMVVALVLVVLLSMGMGMGSTSLFATSLEDMSNSDMAQLLILGLLFFVLLLPVIMMVWFAPALICLHDIKPWQAMKMSLQACLRNIVPFIVYSLVMLLVMMGLSTLVGGIITGMIFLVSGNEMVGMMMAGVLIIPFALLTTIFLSITYYTSYRSIWTTPTLED